MQKILCLALAAVLATAAIVKQDVTYMDGTEELAGYIAYDDAWPSPRPGVMVASDWDGLTSHEKEAVDRLVGLGYTAFANGVYTPAETEAAKVQSARGALTTKYASNNTLWYPIFLNSLYLHPHPHHPSYPPPPRAPTGVGASRRQSLT
jgi:dienelactone hydrolase